MVEMAKKVEMVKIVGMAENVEMVENFEMVEMKNLYKITLPGGRATDVLINTSPIRIYLKLTNFCLGLGGGWSSEIKKVPSSRGYQRLKNDSFSSYVDPKT